MYMYHFIFNKLFFKKEGTKKISDFFKLDLYIYYNITLRLKIDQSIDHAEQKLSRIEPYS